MQPVGEQLPGADDVLRAELQPTFELLRPLGTGTTARVYLAREPGLKRLVAVKVLRPELATDAVMRQRFEREAQSAAQISHSHVTKVHSVGRLRGDIPYIVMEYIDGRTVRDIVESGSTFEIGAARTLLASVASALAAAHDHGIVHRDVRPGNVYVENRTARAVLGDFGIAALLESGANTSTRLTAAGVRLGEPRYMSPEQIRGDPVTEQSDIYAFGILAYEVLTGDGPYVVANDAQLLAAHLKNEPRRLRELRSDVDASLATLLERCLAKDPNRRPRSAELATALAATERPPAVSIADVPEGAFDQFLSELRKRRVYRVLVAYGAFALGVFGLAQGIEFAFTLSDTAKKFLAIATLTGFPVAMVLAWVYDFRAGRIHRSRPVTATKSTRLLMWLGLAISVLLAAAIGWLLLRN